MATTTTMPLTAKDREALAVLGLMIAQTQAPGPSPGRESWIRRRTDRVDLLDEETIRYSLELEMEVPPTVLADIPTASAPIIPLVSIRRGKRLRALELRDEQGTRVPLATPEECGELAVRGLRAYADVMLIVSDSKYPGHSKVLDGEVSKDLVHIVLDTSESADAWERFETAATATVAPPGEEDYQRWLLMTRSDDAGRDISLRSILQELTHSFALAAAVSGSEAAGRRILTLGWTETFRQRDQSYSNWLTLRMAWSDIKLGIPVDVGRTRNYIIEMAPPTDDLAIKWGGLAVAAVDPVTSSRTSVYRDCDDRSPAQLRFTMRSLPTGGEVRPDASATFAILPNRVGFLMIAWFSCVLGAIMVTFASMKRGDLGADGGDISPLLLFVPSLLGIFFIRPGEHPVAARFFSGVRVVVIAAAVCVLAAAGLVSVELDPALRDVAWYALPVVPIMAALTVTVSVLPLVRRRPQVGDEAGLGDEPAFSATQQASSPTRYSLRTAVAVVALIAIALAWGVLSVGPGNLGVAGRFDAALRAAGAAPGASGHGRLALGSFARVPWSRMYIFPPKTPRDDMADVVGEAKVSKGEQRDRELRSMGSDASLVVLVDHESVIDTIELAHSDTRVSNAAYPTQCFLRPSDVVRVRDDAKEDAAPRTISVATPDPDCQR